MSVTISSDRCIYTPSIPIAIQSVLTQFDSIMRMHVLFNAFFLVIAGIELLILLFFFTFLIKSALLALSLAIIFLTVFSYLILRVYFQTRKAEQFLELKSAFADLCKEHLKDSLGTPDEHLALANAYSRFAGTLQNKEASFYTPPHALKFLAHALSKLSTWCHWSDVHKMREIFLLAAVEEHIRLVKCEPTSMAAHASLANAYIMLSGLYTPPNSEEERWSPKTSQSEILEKKFRASAERAIEEFKILSTFAPDDPWVHAQLAHSYRDLKMPLEEIREYETLLRLNPIDMDTMYKLAIRYFQQGMNAQGLRIYEQLKGNDIKRATDLIAFYGAYQPF